jgi:hypothetical protein
MGVKDNDTQIDGDAQGARQHEYFWNLPPILKHVLWGEQPLKISGWVSDK